MSAENIQAIIKLCYAIAGVVVVCGTLDIYIAMNTDVDIKKSIKWTISLFFILVALANIIEKVWL